MSSVVSAENGCPKKRAGVPFKRGSSEARAASVAPSSLEVSLDGRIGWMMERNSPDCICVYARFHWWGLGVCVCGGGGV